jgi:toxin-antitoxin system PIN domain toxin
MRSLFAVNVLIALIDPLHLHHREAHAWWAANEAGGWATCPLTENAFVRILSQASYPRSVSVGDAMRRLRNAAAESNHAFWGDDISLLDSQRFNGSGILAPKRLTGIYLLGIAVKNGGRLATFDRATSRNTVTGAEPRNLVVI